MKLEFGARGDPWPAEQRNVRPLIAESFPGLFDVPDVTVRALRPERTFWEKLLLLHEVRCRPTDRPVRRAMSRHYYDVWRLIIGGTGAVAMQDVTLFQQVLAHRRVYFRQNRVDYDRLTRDSIEILPAPDHLGEWRADYAAMQQEMFTTPPPPFDEILTTIEKFQHDRAWA